MIFEYSYFWFCIGFIFFSFRFGVFFRLITVESEAVVERGLDISYEGEEEMIIKVEEGCLKV